MNELPEFFRTEVYHPLFVHFPIVLLLIATLFKIVSLWSKKVTYSEGGSILLILGVISVWIAVYTGDQADGIVSRQLCDPTVLKEHENLATTTAWIFSMALVLDLLLRYVESFRKKSAYYIVALLMLAGSVTLTLAGHHGAELVYQQAAGVNVPSEDCSEFN
ncbi:DUF2231 domain-containing protein [Christiangramia flava]|uniref:Uncharacterized protein n=1 Tax=Christiangramia flava JLT2011 TaxID=1229726 RepID=A0A1L7I8L9_9FLAO|nr:DUF2231 domain-containing protein [Christiangramia flava]APU69574.1 hypothetical protein GRFL_2850 [Christiangramia flava JLT2011]OSS39394.1 hypothetical protein C723_1940 [Christiangramia flava JLT2011]